MPDVRATLDEVLSGKGDEQIVAYICGVLEDEHFDFGVDGEEAYEAIGPFLVEGGCCDSDGAARAACKELAARLAPGAQPAGGQVPASQGARDRAARAAAVASAGAAAAASAAATEALNAAAAAAAMATGGGQAGQRALGAGPLHMGAVGGKALLFKEESGKHMIQVHLRDIRDGALPAISEKDRARIDKIKAKEASTGRAAFEAVGGPATCHLDNFNVSNGGKDLIEDASVMLAYGRRYGLVGRNGTGKTSLLRAMAAHDIPGIPANCQILHVEQEVAVLACDGERTALLRRRLPCWPGCKRSAGRGRDRPGGLGQDRHPPRCKPLPSRSGGLGPCSCAVSQASGPPYPSSPSCQDRALTCQRLGPAPQRQRSGGGRWGGSSRGGAAEQQAGGGVRPAWKRLTHTEPTNHLDLHAVLWLEEYLVK
ncbi:hypothetical protein QJQ45_022249 [Haematococcus lacustris]|nr:hypothetical protein QJQ45_022249 [Haematococcus lacustris]